MDSRKKDETDNTRSGKLKKASWLPFLLFVAFVLKLATSDFDVRGLLPTDAGRRTRTANNMKKVGLALINFHKAKGRLPAHANYSDGGNPLLSWRVHVLPYANHAELYSQFRLDEP